MSTGRKAGKIIFNICFWIVSVFFAFLALGMFAGGGIVSGVIFLLTALLVNPLIGDLVYNKVVKFPRWIVVIIMVVGFFAGIFTSPSAQTTSDSSSSEPAITEST